MAKILISFLGTGDKTRGYQKANYTMDGFAYETTFISDFLIRKINPDKLLLFGSARSMWEEVYLKFASEKENCDEEIWSELMRFTDEGSHKSDIEEPSVFSALKNCHQHNIEIDAHLIRYGLTDAEHEQNITKILSLLQEVTAGDVVYIDVTHTFRSIPIYGFLLIAYLRQLKNIAVEDVFYGMLDVTREIGYTPVVSLRSLIKLLDWILAVNSFNAYSSAKELAKLMSDYTLSDDLIKSSKNWAYALQLNDNTSLIKHSRNFISQLNNAKAQKPPALFSVLEPQLRLFPWEFSNQHVEWKRLLMLAEHNMVSDRPGLTLMNIWEALVSRFELVFGITPAKKSKVTYESLSKVLRGMNLKDEGIRLIAEIDHYFVDNNIKLHKLRNAVAHGDKVGVAYAELGRDVEKLLQYYTKSLANPRWDELKNKINLKELKI
jgi:CRISPR-associated Csx2 family protein